MKVHRPTHSAFDAGRFEKFTTSQGCPETVKRESGDKRESSETYTGIPGGCVEGDWIHGEDVDDQLVNYRRNKSETDQNDETKYAHQEDDQGTDPRTSIKKQIRARNTTEQY